MMASLGSGGGMLSKIPGFGDMAGAGMPGGFSPSGLLGDATPSRRELEKRRGRQKGKRKQARKARRKNRRR
jgi:hypothetical protein